MTIPEIVVSLNKHLKNMEANHNESGDFYNSLVSATGHKIFVSYAQNDTVYLDKQEAIEYLEWLNAGNVGKHYAMKEDLTLQL